MPEKAHVHQCRYIHTERKDKEKGDNKIVVGYFDFHSTIGIRTNTRPRSDAVITIKIYTTRRVLSLNSSSAWELARLTQLRQSLASEATSNIARALCSFQAFHSQLVCGGGGATSFSYPMPS